MAWVMAPRDSDSGGTGASVVPFLSTLVFVMVSVVPLQLPGLAVVTPSFALMAVFHWTIYRPDLLPNIMVFALGLLLDLLNGTPYIGTSAVTLLVARTVVLSRRRYFVEKDFSVLWLGFLLLAAAMFAFDWAYVALLSGRVLGTRPFVFQAVLTVACYPVGSYLLAWLHRTFLRA